MNLPTWDCLVTTRPLDAPTDALWVKLFDFVRGPRRFLIEASGEWSYAPRRVCGARGDLLQGLEADNLYKNAPRGCLLIKIGGGDSDVPSDDKMIAVGSYCVIEIPETVSGALFATMNDRAERFAQHSGQIMIRVMEASLT